jgi:hypothetical protein
VSYNASVVKFTTPRVLETKIFFFYLEKRSSLLQRWRCSCYSEVVGSAPDLSLGPVRKTQRRTSILTPIFKAKNFDRNHKNEKH